jgi:hypothetical protein
MFCEEVLFIDVSGSDSVERHQLDLACQFCGLGIKPLFIEGENRYSLLEKLNFRSNQALVITSKALAALQTSSLIAALKREDGKRPPLLIVGITPDVDASILCMLSGRAVVGCKSSTKAAFSGFYRVSNMKIVARQLAAGLDIPFACEGTTYFLLDEARSAEPIVHLVAKNQALLFPIFVKVRLDEQDVFFLTQTVASEATKGLSTRFNRGCFFEVAPLIMFLRYTCKEKCWHSPGYYANLTIDDPWLNEPYGFVSYKGLIEEMEKANFHTTIAFIPWNYDRSKREVVSLFQEHPDRFSICVHGNNHDHYEFYKCETEKDDVWAAKPLSVQESSLKQAIARMDKFRILTGLSYDKVFVFPHGIGPAETLGLLKKYNFLATLNSDEVPIGSEEPSDAEFWLRAVTLNFNNFATMHRRWPEHRSKAAIAVDLFLGNPILFYKHHDLFEDGIDAFNKVAEVVNSIEPSIEWRSLGYIARHLYLIRIRHDGNYDVRAFCRTIELKNIQKRDLVFYVRKQESFSPPIQQVTVDGKLYPYEESGSDLCLTITIPAGESRLIEIEYENDLDLSAIDTSKNDARINLLRRLSDFRDITLSRNILGRALVYSYYQTGIWKHSLKTLGIKPFMLVVAVCAAARYLLRRIRRHGF